MKKFYKITIMILIIALVLSLITFATGTKKTIEVLFNSVKLTVNGEKVNADTIAYNGVTYVPLRATAEMLGKDVGWDQKTMTASITDIKATENKDAAIASGDKKITLDQVPIEIKLLPPDSIGSVYMEAFYYNNTNLPIMSYNATALLKDKNEKTYLSNHDTVLPGEKSPNFNSFGPLSQNKDDMEILITEIRFDLNESKYLLVEYDHKLKRYNYKEYERY